MLSIILLALSLLVTLSASYFVVTKLSKTGTFFRKTFDSVKENITDTCSKLKNYS